MIDIGNDSSDEDEEGPVKKKQATEGGEEGVSTPPLIDLVGHCDDGFYLTKKVMTVTQLAEMFACDPLEYLRLLKQYDGWYQELKTPDSKVAARSDVPVPRLAAEKDAARAHPRVRSDGETRKEVAKSRTRRNGNTVDWS